MWLWALACRPDYALNETIDPPDEAVDTDVVVDSDRPADEDPCTDLDYPAAEVAPNLACDNDLATGGFDPVIEWSFGSGSFCGPAAVAPLTDTNGSGALDAQDLPMVVVYGPRSQVIAITGAGAMAWETSIAYGHDGGLAIGDVDGDGWPEIITADATSVCALEGADGAEAWCRGGLGGALDPFGMNFPAIADMDGDGVPEVTVGSLILDGPTGEVVGHGALGRGAAPYAGDPTETYGALSVPADLDGDGELELVTGNAAYRKDGSAIWGREVLDGLVAVADFDGDGQGEIVKTSGIYAIGMETDGTNAWRVGPFAGNLGPPAIDDLDGDGVPEMVFAAQNQLVALRWGGGEMWRAPIADVSGAAGPTLFDFEMDGYPEVLFADETSIRFFSGLDGSVKYTHTHHASYTVLETPIVADVDGDDEVEIVLGHCQGDDEIGLVTVYGDEGHSWPPGRKIWNQHAYSITNVTDLGGIPASAPHNWPEFNSFRSGDVGRPPRQYVDLQAEILGVCESECATRVVIEARVRNAGNVEAPAKIPVILRAGGDGPVVGETMTSTPIAPGRTGETLRFIVGAVDIAGKIPTIFVDERQDGTGAVYECDESNNGDGWGAPACP